MKASRKKNNIGTKVAAVPISASRMAPLISLLTPVAIALLTMTAFLPALGSGFVNWDDDKNFSDNLDYRGLGWAQLQWMFTTFHLGHYQPLSWITLGVDYLLWGMDPFGYHLTNLVLHSVNAVLFYYLSLRLIRLADPLAEKFPAGLAAGFAALFFSLHPLRVESVAWVTERRDVLSGAFLLGATLLYFRAIEPERALRRPSSLAASVILYALSLLAKASGMTLPLVLLALDVYPLKRLFASPGTWWEKRFRGVWMEKIPFFILAAAAAIVALAAQWQSGALVKVQVYGIGRRLGQTMYALVFYPWKTIAPFHLSPLYQVPFRLDGWNWLFVLSGVAVLTITGTLVILRRTLPALLAVWVVYLLFVIPIAGVAQSGVQLVADRYSYLSCLSWAVLGGAGFYYFSCNNKFRARAAVSMGTVILLACGILTWRQTRIWHDSETLWTRAAGVAPESSIARYNLAVVLESQRNIRAAVEEYREAVRLDPAYAEARYNLARILAREGKTEEAITQYRNALSAEPNDADARNNLALLLIKQGEWAEAVEQLRQTLEIDPKHARSHYNLGRVLARQGDLDGAVAHFQQSLQVEPNVAEIHENLARALAQQGKRDEAVKHYEEALRLMR